MGFQFSSHEQAFFFKLVCVKSLNEQIIGFHYVGPNAGEITVGIGIAMRLKLTKNDFVWGCQDLLTITFLETCSCTTSSKFLWFLSTRIRNKKGTIIFN